MLPEIADIVDLNQKGKLAGQMRLELHLRRDAIPNIVLNKLYKHTALQTTFGANMVALVDGVPRTLGLVDLITHYLAHQEDVITRRTQLELRKAEARAHILEGYLIALQHLDEVIALIRTSADAEAARTGLMERFGLSEEQGQAILDLRLQRLTSLGQDEIRTSTPASCPASPSCAASSATRRASTRWCARSCSRCAPSTPTSGAR